MQRTMLRARTHRATVTDASRGSGTISLNGAAARLGDQITILACGFLDSAEALTHTPRSVYVDEGNRIARTK